MKKSIVVSWTTRNLQGRIIHAAVIWVNNFTRKELDKAKEWIGECSPYGVKGQYGHVWIVIGSKWSLQEFREKQEGLYLMQTGMCPLGGEILLWHVFIIETGNAKW